MAAINGSERGRLRTALQEMVRVRPADALELLAAMVSETSPLQVALAAVSLEPDFDGGWQERYASLLVAVAESTKHDSRMQREARITMVAWARKAASGAVDVILDWAFEAAADQHFAEWRDGLLVLAAHPQELLHAACAMVASGDNDRFRVAVSLLLSMPLQDRLRIRSQVTNFAVQIHTQDTTEAPAVRLLTSFRVPYETEDLASFVGGVVHVARMVQFCPLLAEIAIECFERHLKEARPRVLVQVLPVLLNPQVETGDLSAREEAAAVRRVCALVGLATLKFLAASLGWDARCRGRPLRNWASTLRQGPDLSVRLAAGELFTALESEFSGCEQNDDCQQEPLPQSSTPMTPLSRTASVSEAEIGEVTTDCSLGDVPSAAKLKGKALQRQKQRQRKKERKAERAGAAPDPLVAQLASDLTAAVVHGDNFAGLSIIETEAETEVEAEHPADQGRRTSVSDDTMPDTTAARTEARWVPGTAQGVTYYAWCPIASDADGPPSVCHGLLTSRKTFLEEVTTEDEELATTTRPSSLPPRLTSPAHL